MIPAQVLWFLGGKWNKLIVTFTNVCFNVSRISFFIFLFMLVHVADPPPPTAPINISSEQFYAAGCAGYKYFFFFWCVLHSVKHLRCNQQSLVDIFNSLKIWFCSHGYNSAVMRSLDHYMAVFWTWSSHFGAKWKAVRLSRLSAAIRVLIDVPRLKRRVGTGVLIRQPGVTPLLAAQLVGPADPPPTAPYAHIARTYTQKQASWKGFMFIVNRLGFVVSIKNI